MPLTLEVRHLELVRAIAESGSVARAAETLYLSQPALSHALRSLEERLGVRLFERARRMTPTPAGAELARRATQILGSVHEAETWLRHHRSGASDVVRVATCCYTCYHWLPQALQRLRGTLPSATVRIVGEATPHAVDALLDGELDLAVVHFKPSDRRIAVDRLFTDEQVLVTSPDHPLASRRFVTAEDFRDLQLLAHYPPQQTVFWTTYLEPAGVRPLAAESMHTTEAVVESVKAGLGVSVLARWAVSDELARGTLAATRISQRGLRRVWYAATIRGRQSAATLALRDVLRDSVAAR